MNYFLKKKKWLAWVIMLTFLFTSFMPSNIMAGNSVAEAAPSTEDTIAGQIELNPGEKVLIGEDGKEEVKIQKSIEAGSAENEFNITLKVSTPEKLEEIPSSADAAVVLVMDTSGSMAYDICNQTHTHNKECYDYTCGKEEHTHSDRNCYEWKLTCKSESWWHTHTWDCYSKELTCDKTEHQHNNNCSRKLTCGKEEHRQHTAACKVSRMKNAKDAAKTFIEAYQESATEVPGKRMLATVRFSGDASKVFDWVDVAANGWDTSVGGSYGATVGSQINNLGTNGGTNMAGGLQLAHNIIKDATGSKGVLAGIDNITVILLTDGCPTYHISDGEWDDTDVISGSEGGGSVASWTDQQHAKTAANNVKDISTLKVIALSTGTDSYKESENGNYKNKDTATWLQENIGSTYRATDAESLADSFEQIGALILLGTQAWRATDPMAANIVYTGNPDGENANDDDDKMGNSYTWNVDTKTINWNLKSSYPVESQEQADGTIWYTYELEYPVRLDNTAEGFTFDQDLVTNGTTELKYFMFSKVKENDEEKEDDKVEPDPLELKTAYFDVPKVEGYAGSLDVTKTALDEKTLLSGAKFELQYLCDENQHTGNIKTNVPTNISGEDGKLILNNIPSGHIYKLVEAQAPEGYEAEKTAKYAIKVAFGQVSYCELDDSGNLPDSPKWTAIPVAGLSLTNKKLPGSKQITVTKNWVTQENFTPTVKLEVLQDGKAFALADSLPDNVSVQDGHTYINLTEQKGVNIVKSVVTTLQVPQFKQNGTEYQYTVREIVDDNAIITTDGAATIDGQKWQVAFSGNGLTVTNSYIGTTSVSGTKTWLDGDDENRPTSVQVALYANNVAVDVNGDGSVTAADYQTVTGTEWTFTFSNLPKYDANGAEISYSVKEVGEANGSITIGGKDYTVSYAGYNIINLLTGTTSVSGTKTWLDGDDENRPTSVQVALYANNVAVDVNGDGSVTAADYQTVTGTEWTFTFSNLPKYDANGAEISYSVKEVGEANGSITIGGKDYTVSYAGYNIINLLTGTTSVSGTKTWLDGDDENRPTSVQVALYANNVAVDVNGDGSVTAADYQTVTGTEWTFTFSNLPKYDANGAEISYSVKEVGEANGSITIGGKDYTVSYAGYNIINLLTGTTSVSGTKTWLDGDDENRPTSVQVALYANNVAVDVNGDGSVTAADYQTVTGVAWTFTFSNLPKYDANGAEISYSVKEVGEANGSITIGGKDYTVSYAGYNITNLLTGTTSVSGTKTWLDGDDENRPASVQVALYANNVAVDVNGDGSVTAADYQTVTGAAWTFTFSNLPKYDANGAEISYSVKEVGEANGSITIGGKDYTVNYAGYNITNTITQDYVSVSGEKIWKVPTDVEIPESITVQLFRDNGAEPISTTTTAVDWTYSFDNLPKYAVGEAVGEGEVVDGHEYIYTVKEVKVDGFTTKYNGYDIINTYDRSADTEVSVQKRWIDFGTNVTTHSAITIELYQNNVLYDTVQLSDENDWNTTFVELPKYDANQQPFDYTVKEVAVAGYTTTILEVEDNKFVVTNTLMLGKPGEITVEKQTTGDKKPGNDVKFKFELQVQITRPEGTNVLFDAMALSELDLGDAASNLNDAMDAVQASAMLVTSSSTYQYLLTEKENEFATEATALMGVKYEGTTTSAIKLAVAPSELSEDDYEYQYNLTKNIVETLVALSDEYKDYTLEDMLVALAGEIPLDREDGYAVAMDMNAVTWLIDASRDYSYLVALEPDAPATTTPSALQIFMNGSTSPSALTYVADGDYYAVDFWLANGEKAVFDIQATTGSAISYKIVETLDPATEKDYVGTSIFDSVNNQTTSGTAIGFVAYNENEPMSYLFTNNYANNPYIPPVDPVDPVDPGDDPDIEIEDPDVPLTDPEEPVIEIEDPDVPLIDVPGEEVEIDEPEVPLGDAPQTGDNSNTIPFVVLMLAAACGLVVTRRKLN